jgi:hypothetical protein
MSYISEEGSLQLQQEQVVKKNPKEQKTMHCPYGASLAELQLLRTSRMATITMITMMTLPMTTITILRLLLLLLFMLLIRIMYTIKTPKSNMQRQTTGSASELNARFPSNFHPSSCECFNQQVFWNLDEGAEDPPRFAKDLDPARM